MFRCIFKKKKKYMIPETCKIEISNNVFIFKLICDSNDIIYSVTDENNSIVCILKDTSIIHAECKYTLYFAINKLYLIREYSEYYADNNIFTENYLCCLVTSNLTYKISYTNWYFGTDYIVFERETPLTNTISNKEILIYSTITDEFSEVEHKVTRTIQPEVTDTFELNNFLKNPSELYKSIFKHKLTLYKSILKERIVENINFNQKNNKIWIKDKDGFNKYLLFYYNYEQIFTICNDIYFSKIKIITRDFKTYFDIDNIILFIPKEYMLYDYNGSIHKFEYIMSRNN